MSNVESNDKATKEIEPTAKEPTIEECKQGIDEVHEEWDAEDEEFLATLRSLGETSEPEPTAKETFIELTEDEFVDKYALVPNHINPSASWTFGDGAGRLFETSGVEFEFVSSSDPRKVWTLVDGDDGDMCVISGLHYLNRVGYFLSRDAVPENTTVQVNFPMDTDDEEGEDDEDGEESEVMS
jgi:hypothetical protein